jgi:hypothetical protein
MRYVMLVLAIAYPIGMALAAVPDGTVDKLNHAAGSRVAWNVAKARVADVTCDGKPDVVIFGTSPISGSSQRTIWMGMVPGGGDKAQVMRFPEAGVSEDAFDTPPTRISIYPLNCEGEDGPFDGCRPRKGCKEFSFDSGETDPFHFYWDDRHKRLGWWRL